MAIVFAPKQMELISGVMVLHVAHAPLPPIIATVTVNVGNVPQMAIAQEQCPPQIHAHQTSADVGLDLLAQLP